MTTNETTARAATLAAIVARKTTLPPHLIAAKVTHLQRIARQAVTIATNLCNLPDYQQTYEARIARLRSAASLICASLGADFSVKLGGDPRSCCCRLFIAGERGDFGGADDGFPVY